jgi:hypothetical protein
MNIKASFEKRQSNEKLSEEREDVQNKILSFKCFETYSNQEKVIPDAEKQTLSLNEIINKKEISLDVTVFQGKFTVGDSDEVSIDFKGYFIIKLNKLELFGNHFKVVNI